MMRYLFVGAGSNLINFGTYCSICFLGFSLFVSSAMGYLAGLFVSYHFGRIWVFGRKFEINKQNIIRFLTVYAVGGLGMSALIVWLNHSLALDYRFSWLFGAAFAVVNNFLGQKWFVFNKGKTENGK